MLRRLLSQVGATSSATVRTCSEIRQPNRRPPESHESQKALHVLPIACSLNCNSKKNQENKRELDMQSEALTLDTGMPATWMTELSRPLRPGLTLCKVGLGRPPAFVVRWGVSWQKGYLKRDRYSGEWVSGGVSEG